jgi:pilus assembly protein FimV
VSKSSAVITAATLALTASFAAHAAGLGRLTILSPLGAPLNAEIEVVSLQPGEEDGLTARVASAEAFRQAGIEPTAQLRTMRFSVVQRAGRPVIRITSTQPINEPFVDLLVELEWKGGRLVREYTFLLDPPELTGRQAIAATPAPQPQAAPAVQAAPLPTPATAPVAETPSAPAPESAPAPVAQTREPAAPVAQPLPAGPAAQTHQVRRGDTLGEIARANLAPGVSLNQMLIAIYRANPDAFIRDNVNLVRAGRVLSLPGAEVAGSVEAAEATRLVQSHRAEWDEYRSRLAAAPAPAEAASGQRAVAGRIEAKPEATPPAASQDQVRLSKAEPKAGNAERAARADDAAARQRELTEAQSRVSDLEKNVADLQKLLELKNQQLAELEKKATPAKPAAAAPAPVPAPVPEAKKANPAPVAAAPAPAPEAKKAEPAPQPKKAEAAKAKPKAAPPPAGAPSLLDEFLNNPIALAGLGAVIVLLLGYFFWSWRRKKATQAKFSDSVLGTAGGSAASLGASGPATGGGSGSQASVSQASGMDAEEVDPIAEADVYMAYGRDAQAEEILREALQKDPGRIPVHAKLLEIYAKRSDTQAFEQTALKLKNLTHGAGAEWDKAAALGRSIDPRNGLYGAAAASSTVAAVAMGAAAAMPAFAVAGGAPAIDFDIGAGASSPSMATTDIPFDSQPRASGPSSVDFDLGAGTLPPGSSMAAIKELDADVTVTSLDLNLDASGVEDKIASLPPLAPAAESASGIDFDLNLDDGDKQDGSTPVMDLSSISLDLGSAGEPGGAPSNDPKWQEVATKLDLAKAYEEMGDKDGARELLGEVMKDGDAAQKGQAQQLLTKLG